MDDGPRSMVVVVPLFFTSRLQAIDAYGQRLSSIVHGPWSIFPRAPFPPPNHNREDGHRHQGQ